VIVFADLTCDLTRSVTGQAMNNIAAMYSALGRHQDALVLQEKTLEFWRRALPQSHPDLGTSCFNLSLSYRQTGDFHRAIERAREALRIWQAALPPSHPHVKMAQEFVLDILGDIAQRA
jgi:tetratricopeptide (TPR) repeat protein